MVDRRSGEGQTASNGVGVRLRDLAPVPGGRPLERLDRSGLVDVDDGIELVGETRSEVVVLPLGVRALDDADGPLQASRAEGRHGLRGVGEPHQELLRADLVEDLLDAAGQGRPHPLALRPPSPVVCRGHRAPHRRSSG